jgi:hypothetical protein
VPGAAVGFDAAKVQLADDGADDVTDDEGDAGGCTTEDQLAQPAVPP